MLYRTSGTVGIMHVRCFTSLQCHGLATALNGKILPPRLICERDILSARSTTDHHQREHYIH